MSTTMIDNTQVNTNVKKYTYSEIAADWRLWIEYADPSGVGSKEEFHHMSIEEKIAFLVKCFGPEFMPED